MNQPNVLPFDQEEFAAECKKAEEERTEAFNQLYSDYLAAVADGIRPLREGEEEDFDAKTNAAVERQNELLWKLIGTNAECEYHVGYKFDILIELAGCTWSDARVQRLVESIRSDTVGRD